MSTTAACQGQAADAQEQLMRVDITKVLNAKGPIVKAVVLRCDGNDNDGKQCSATEHVLADLVEEMEIDTTPKKSEVEKILGGRICFVGQYEDEGIVLMARDGCVKYDEEDVDDKAGKSKHCNSNADAPINPHRLQPPFDAVTVRGNIVILKVAPVEEDDHLLEGTAELPVVSNEEFFLDYGKSSWLEFAARTDVVPPAIPDFDDSDEECGSDEDEPDQWSGDEDDEEEEVDSQLAMFQMLLSAVLQKFGQENGRDPDGEELVCLQAALAEKLGIDLQSLEEQEGKVDHDGEDTKDNTDNNNLEDDGKENNENGKRSSDLADAAKPEPKKIKAGSDSVEDKETITSGQALIDCTA